jgi:type IV secretory pathway VirB2 component (pilin)
VSRTEQILAALVVVVAGAMLVLGLSGWRDR